MGITFKKSIGAVLGGVAVVGLVAGCSSDGSPTTSDAADASTSASTAASASSTASPADPSKVQGLVLDTSDFPAGYKALKVPTSQMQATIDQLLATTKSAKIVPSKCLQLSAIPESVDVDKLGLVMATKGTSAALSESVAVSPTSISDYRKQASGACSDLKMTVTMSGQSVTSTVHQSIVDGPKVDADESLVLEVDTEAKAAGTTVKTSAVMGYAEVNGYLVSVQATSLTPGSKPDRAAFDDLFTKAVAKVESQA
ncbi:hypothetical protein nbrc107696_09920 [Gordonia spumicola]|uniref:DUF5642 domain-containing protein n=1 Tax=Gordonia spumicola TaxID=589161 RepID=A0A7I9V578_9ACTN|nr:hypothetical protein [Gordonia spumicola]GEE00546.1 hypothetical protein nbrc107696_09920 [Gordonia spumicola]